MGANVENNSGKLISGLGNELEWVMKESGGWFMIKLNDEFWKDLDKAITDESGSLENLREIDETLAREIDQAEMEHIPQGTKCIKMERFNNSKIFSAITT